MKISEFLSENFQIFGGGGGGGGGCGEIFNILK